MRSLILLLSSLCFVGCAASQKDAEKINFTEVKENLRFDNTDIKRQVFDMNRDGKVDMWKFYTIKQGLEQDAPPEYVLIHCSKFGILPDPPVWWRRCLGLCIWIKFGFIDVADTFFEDDVAVLNKKRHGEFDIVA